MRPYRKSDGPFGLVPKKTSAVPWSASDAAGRPWPGELDTADRRLRELEEAFSEEDGAGRCPGSTPEKP